MSADGDGNGAPAGLPNGQPAGVPASGSEPYVIHLPSRGARPPFGRAGRAGDGPAGVARAARPGSPAALLTGGGVGGDGLPEERALATAGAGPLPDLVPSRLLQYLPTLYQGDAFLGRFLRIVEDIISPIEQTIDGVGDTLDPRLAPESFLPWLASWMGVELDEHWPVARQRQLIARAAALYRWRGTRRGLREHLRLYTGYSPLIVENFTGLRLGQDAVLGLNTRLGEYHPHCIFVTAVAAQPQTLDERVLRRIIEAEKPAHTGYLLETQPVPPATGAAEASELTSPGEG